MAVIPPTFPPGQQSRLMVESLFSKKKATDAEKSFEENFFDVFPHIINLIECKPPFYSGGKTQY